MNALERLLQDDMDRLVDRIAGSAREGLVRECAERRPELFGRLEDAEARLSCARQDLVAGYAAWLGALDECADLWALADLAADAPAPAPSLRAA
jgi:hypothetical protein